MSKRYTAFLAAAVAALIASPAMADGYADRAVNRGPAPLQAHSPHQAYAPQPPEPGCYLVGEDTWSCPPLQAGQQTAYGYTSSSASSYAASGYTSTGAQGYAYGHEGHGHAHGAYCGEGYNSYRGRAAVTTYQPAPIT